MRNRRTCLLLSFGRGQALPGERPRLRPVKGTALLSILLAGCSSTADLQCVPFARERSGIALHGDAASWWGQARGRYARGSHPMPGAVLVFRRSAGVPGGHVAVVSTVLSRREVLIDR